jgi:hypothetical protein
MTNQKYFRFQSADIEELFTEGDILLIRNDSFMAEVEALRKDAARYRQLEALKAKLERENKRLAEALANANEQAERFERGWYLRGDEIERLQEVSEEATDAREQQPVAYRAWFDKDNGARWLFTLWPEEERLDVDWEPLFTAPKATIPLP